MVVLVGRVRCARRMSATVSAPQWRPFRPHGGRQGCLHHKVVVRASGLHKCPNSSGGLSETALPYSWSPLTKGDTGRSTPKPIISHLPGCSARSCARLPLRSGRWFRIECFEVYRKRGSHMERARSFNTYGLGPPLPPPPLLPPPIVTVAVLLDADTLPAASNALTKYW